MKSPVKTMAAPGSSARMCLSQAVSRPLVKRSPRPAIVALEARALLNHRSLQRLEPEKWG
jgi:hypothetical protein